MSLLHRARSQIFGSSPKSNPQLFARSPKGNPVAAQKGPPGPPGAPADPGLYPYDLITYFPEIAIDGEKLWGFVADRQINFGAGLLGSKALATIAATADTVLTLKKNGAAIATVRFAAGAPTGTFTAAAEFDLVAGDELTLWAPTPADLTLSQIEVTLYGTRSPAGESGTIPGQVGPAGPDGAAGPPGADGAAGATGPMGGTVAFTAGGAITKGVGLYVSGSGAYSPGDCTNDAKSDIPIVASADALLGASGTGIEAGVVAGCLAGATPGTPYFLGPTGAPVLYAALAARTRIVQLGIAVNATDLDVKITDLGWRP